MERPVNSVFISYSTSSPDIADSLRSKLEKEDIKVWMGDTSIHAGTRWQKAIEDGIIQSDLLVVILDENSAESAYVTFEWAFALGNGKAVIPVKTVDCKVHPRLEDLQIYFLLIEKNNGQRPWNGLIKLIKDIRISKVNRYIFPSISEILFGSLDT